MVESRREGGDILTHLIGQVEPRIDGAALRVGDAVVLRADRRGRELEAWSSSGHRLGRVPPEERDALAALPAGAAVQGWITALVPRPMLAGAGRIHIRITAD